MIAAENEGRLKWKAVRHEMHMEGNIVCYEQIVFRGNLTTVDKKRVKQSMLLI